MTNPSALHLTFCAQTDIGQVRKGNEDNFLILDLAGETSWTGIDEEGTGLQNLDIGTLGIVFAVSDGMGGALAGEVASRMAVEIVRDLLPQLQAHEEYGKLNIQEQLRVAIEQANSAIHIESIVNSQCHGMGATFTAVALANNAACFAQVGDSRAHLLRDGKLTRITKDQSVVQQLIDLGQITEEDAVTHPRRNYILQALGATHEIDVVVSYLPLRADDVLLLCSDGLSGKMTNEEMAEVILAAADLQEACTQLIQLANERGGEDNITVILAKIRGEQLVAPNDEPIEPELIARPPDMPRDFLLEDVGLSPPLDNTAQRFVHTADDLPVSLPASSESEFSPPTSADVTGSEPDPAPNQRRLDGRKVAGVFIALALLLSVTAVYLNYRFTPERNTLQQRLQKEQQGQIEALRVRIANLRARTNGSPEINTQLDVFSQRLDEAAALPPTKYQDVGRACSEVENALYLLERKQDAPK
ncbi:MAG TPA: PP2C family serine/threonine-protein phosphatase [Blastocatellia bacterium]|nr:PP2C family serine/threonine-protein phosphatase [Blastocatellia bacterium]